MVAQTRSRASAQKKKMARDHEHTRKKLRSARKKIVTAFGISPREAERLLLSVVDATSGLGALYSSYDVAIVAIRRAAKIFRKPEFQDAVRSNTPFFPGLGTVNL